MGAIEFVLESVVGFFLLTVLLRFVMQAVRAPFRDPLGQFVIRFTDWAVLPARRVIPSWRGYDLASLVVALLGAWLLRLLEWVMHQNGLGWVGGLGFALTFLGALIYVLQLFLYLLIGATLVLAILSWVQPYHPFMSVLGAVLRPLLSPIQKLLPPVAGVDLSPLVLLLLLQLVLNFVLPEFAALLQQLILGI